MKSVEFRIDFEVSASKNGNLESTLRHIRYVFNSKGKCYIYDEYMKNNLEGIML